ncbi:MAG TPA: T9SS type A sorting domain-containing protein [Puia sp.]|nr:T9SS type A sorting domain-containing protein [Puia sp.]
MRKFYKLFLAGLLCLFCNAYFAAPSYAQVQTARYVSTSANSNGFYEYLPAGYSSGAKKYPLLVFLNGIGELGNGGSDLPKVLDNGPPQLISQGKFPTSFTVNGQTFSFIVISPQFVAWPSDGDVNAVINYALANYRVDTSRIYLTGLSMGGGATWSYASNSQYAGMLAAIVPIAGGNLWGGAPAATAMAVNNLPIFAAANLNDPTVPSSYTVSDVQLINSIVPAINPPALDTIYNASGHGGWQTTYDPNTNLHNGLNVYQWMLQYSRSAVSGPIPLPVKLADFTATLLSGTPQTELSWTTTFEQNNRYFLIQRSQDGEHFSVIDTVAAASDAENGHSYAYTDQRPLTGADYYRLAQVDLDGTTNYSEIREVLVQQSSDGGMSLSPNPADALVYLELGGSVSGSVEVRLLDVQGRALRSWVFQKPEGTWSQSLDVSGLASGSYFIQVAGTNYQAIKTFIKR